MTRWDKRATSGDIHGAAVGAMAPLPPRRQPTVSSHLITWAASGSVFLVFLRRKHVEEGTRVITPPTAPNTTSFPSMSGILGQAAGAGHPPICRILGAKEGKS